MDEPMGRRVDTEEAEHEAQKGALARDVETWRAYEADTLCAEADDEEPRRPTVPPETANSVEQAQAYDSLFRQAAEPKTLGRYVVLDALGRGGMGIVLRAYDRQLDRAVALKVLRRTLYERHAQRLRREAQAMAKLSHPNVVQVYEVGEVKGQTFVAMEFVRGKTVDAWVSQEPRPGWRRCVESFIQLGAGLAAAHEQGLVHRDFKPSNAMIDDKGRARVLDFGLARIEEDGAAEPPSGTLRRVRKDSTSDATSQHGLTETGAVLGTPAYMSLEQMSGQPADPRSDQFSFCVALYEAVYGERPYAGDTLPELFTSMYEGRVRAPPRGSDVPPALRKILLRGLVKPPEQRWPSMETLLDALRRVVAPRRRRGLALLVAVGLMAVGGGLGATRALEWFNRCTGARKQLAGVWDDQRQQEVRASILGTSLSYAPSTWARLEPRLDAYADAWATEYTNACEATHSRSEQSEQEMSLRMACLHERRQHLDATLNELGRADAIVVERAVQATTRLPGLERCQDLRALRAEVPPPEDPAVAQQVAALGELLVEAKAKQESGKYGDGLRLADHVVQRGEALGYEPLMARAWQRQGRLRMETGDYDGAVPVLEDAYRAAVAHSMKAEAADVSAALMRVQGSSLNRYAEAFHWATNAEPLSRAAGTQEARAEYLHDLGAVAYSQAEYGEARASYEQALAIRQRAFDPENPAIAASLNNLGNVASSLAEYDKARRLHERALTIFQDALGPDHPNVATSLLNLGRVASSEGEYEEARASYERSLSIFEEALGPEHPKVAFSVNNLANLALTRADYPEALELYQRALTIFEEALGPRHPNVAFSLSKLGNVAHQRGQYVEARQLHQRALVILQEALGHDHYALVGALHGLGNAAHSQADYDAAQVSYERALDITVEAFGHDHLNITESLRNLGNLATSRADYEGARDFHQRALDISSAGLGGDHPDVANALDDLGRVAHLQGEYEQARDFHQRALAIFMKTSGSGHPDVARSLHGLGNVAHSQGDYELARQSYEQALGIFERSLGPNHPDVARMLNNLGSGADLQGRYTEARVLHERALVIFEHAFGPDHPTVASMLNNLGDVSYRQGKYRDARRSYSRALASFEAVFGADHPRVAFALTGLGETMLALGDPAGALPALERALDIRERHDVDPGDLAENRFLLARALWTTAAARGRDRLRARELAEQARDAYTALGEAMQDRLDEVSAWLVEHHEP